MFLPPFKTDVKIRNHNNPLPVNYINSFPKNKRVAHSEY